MLYHSSLELIGRTPLVKLSRIQVPNNNQIYAKLEGANPAGGVKDRVALHILSKLRDEGRLTKDSIIIEATAGNTGLGIAFVALHFGVQARLIVPDKFSIEKQVLMRALGAEVINTPKSEGMQGAIALARQMIESNPNAISLNQFENLENPRAHYLTTAREIWEDLSNSSFAPFSRFCEREASSLPPQVTPAPKSTQSPQSNTANTRIVDSNTQDSELQSGESRPQSSLESPDLLKKRRKLVFSSQNKPCAVSLEILECQRKSNAKDSQLNSESTTSDFHSITESTALDSKSILESTLLDSVEVSESRVADSKPTQKSTPPVIASVAKQSTESAQMDCHDFANAKSRNDGKTEYSKALDLESKNQAESAIALDSKKLESGEAVGFQKAKAGDSEKIDSESKRLAESTMAADSKKLESRHALESRQDLESQNQAESAIAFDSEKLESRHTPESSQATESTKAKTGDSKKLESTPPLLHYFIAGAGSGGSFSGIARFLKEQDSRIKAVLCDPVGSIIGGGCEGCANIEGIGNSFIPATMDTHLIDKVIKIADEEAYAGVRLLASTEGILAGISSGACLQACLKLAEEVSDSIIVTLFADDFSRYFSRNLIL